MSRQFKTMQSDLISEVNRLENLTFELNTKLTGVQHVYTEATKVHAAALIEKDQIIEELNMKMSFMTNEFESMLSETLSKVTKKLEFVSTRWKENDQISLSEQNVQRLSDFQLVRLVLKFVYDRPLEQSKSRSFFYFYKFIPQNLYFAAAVYARFQIFSESVQEPFEISIILYPAFSTGLLHSLRLYQTSHTASC